MKLAVCVSLKADQLTCMRLLAFTEVLATAVLDFSVETVPPAEGSERGLHRRNQLLQPHLNGHQLPTGEWAFCELVLSA